MAAGISGGADSVCLLVLLLEYRKQLPFELAVVHVNHGIRKEAAEDAAYVEELCRREGVPFHLRTADVRGFAAEERCSEEDAGRRLRYQAFEEVAAECGANKIAVAHNSNDRAETMLFHLFRGSGLKGLRGILPVRGKIIRPLLALERGEIEAYLRERGIAWCTDSTNAEDSYARNRIRHHILPYAEEALFPGVVEHMGRTAQLLAETEEYLAERTAEALESCLNPAQTKGRGNALSAEDAGGRIVTGAEVSLSAEKFLGLPPVLQRRVLLQLAESLSPTGKDIGEIHVRKMQELFAEAGNRSISLPMGITARRQYDKVILEQRQTEQPEETGVLPEMEFTELLPKKDMEVPKNQYTKWFNYDRMKESPTVRFRQTGDYLTISDGKGGMLHKSLKDYMITEKIPRQLRNRIPVLAEGSHVIWLVGYRMSEYYKVDRNTKRILQVQLKGNCIGSETEEKDVRTH